ncbi:MAG: aldehyde dehydrogenase (NADP(+)) [Alcanivoracaceae bacterium]|nr:aldehyde dehydrogenase (NADP(+)) [Alcanivoracaceae bacterium]
MSLSGLHFIGSDQIEQNIKSSQNTFNAINPTTGETLEPNFIEGTGLHAQFAAKLATKAFAKLSLTSSLERAEFLETIAEEIMNLGDELIARTQLETALPKARLEGERGRTCNQLRLFAEVLREGSWVNAIIDTADADRLPLPKPDTRSMNIAIGPVVVFGASNFPLAFSVAGGDTASVLAAGCPVIVKAHPAHPGTSELVARAILKAIDKCGLPNGTFSLLQGSTHTIGECLVKEPSIKAVGFTGSLKAGRALFNIATSRPEPIPFYGELGSINPVFLLDGGEHFDSQKFATDYVASLTMGVGQFCTNPGLLILQESDQLNDNLAQIAQQIGESLSGTMLTKNIQLSLNKGINRLQQQKGVELLSKNKKSDAFSGINNSIFTVSAKEFVKNSIFQEELFGPVSLIVICANQEQVLQVASVLQGQLTATIHTQMDDIEFIRNLTNQLSNIAGRVLFNSYPTGVEVCRSMVHGGTYPATTDSRSTSVGTQAIYRFTRPVCFQDTPQKILPNALKNNNPLNIYRMIDGQFTNRN